MKINWSSVKKVGRFIWFMLFILLGVFAVVSIIYDPGYALFVYDRWSVEMPLWIFAISLFAFYILCRCVAYVFQIPSRVLAWLHRHNEKKGIKQLNYAMYALIQGELQNAQKAFLLSAKSLAEPLLAYSQIIKCATKQQDYVAAQAYLNKIKEMVSVQLTTKPRDKMNPSRKLVLNLLEAHLLIKNQNYQSALDILLPTHHEFPAQPKVIYLLHKIYLKQENWTALWDMLPQLQESDYFSPEALFQLEQNIYCGLIRAIADGFQDETALWQIWEKIPRQHKKDPKLFTTFIKTLLVFNRHDDAEIYAHKYLKKNWDDHLMCLYGLIHAEDWQKQLAFAEQWLPYYPRNAALLITLGRLSERNKIYGKARSYYEEALLMKPCREICWLLAELAERLNDNHAALNWYRKAASMVNESVC